MEIPKDLRKNAISLEEIGTSDIAWCCKDALKILDAFEFSDVAVLGGDVLEKDDDSYAYNHDNWSSKIKEGEQWLEYAARSRKEARKYLENYPGSESGQYIFCLVFSDKPSSGQLLKIYNR